MGYIYKIPPNLYIEILWNTDFLIVAEKILTFEISKAMAPPFP